MNLLTKPLILMLASLVLAVTAPQATAITSAGKIENATTDAVRNALVETVKATEAAVDTLKNGGTEDQVNEHIANARQSVKRVEINRLDVIRTRSADNLKKAKQALSKGDRDEAGQFLNNALKGFQEMLSSF